MNSHQIVVCVLTAPEVGDPTAAPDLLSQICSPFTSFMGDGAYDGEYSMKPAHPRALLQQKTEAWISAFGLNIMTNLGMPVSVKNNRQI